MRKKFDGYYYKHQKGKHTLSVIAGKSDSERFIQIITADFSYKVPDDGKSQFTEKGIHLDIQSPQLSLFGDILYGALSPICYDIMGPFQYVPMECKHGIISMYHKLTGWVILNGTLIDFTGGIGYIEKDSGTSFPSSYLWVQANDFDEKCSIMASVAVIPFLRFHFNGCICIIQYRGREYRLATYLGVKIISCTPNKIVLKQGHYKLIIDIRNRKGNSLAAPCGGEMTRFITETVSCMAGFRFYWKNQRIFSLKSQHASFECDGF